jgi:uncharacterized membrane protein YccC
MGLLSDMLPGGSEARRDDRGGSPEELRGLERSVQLCRGVAAAASSMSRRHEEIAATAEELVERLAERLRPLRDRLDAVVPGTLASAHEVAPGHADRSGIEELPADVLRELAERLEAIHFSMLRVGVNREDPEDEGLASDLEDLRDFVDEIEPRLARAAGAAGGPDAGGDEEPG